MHHLADPTVKERVRKAGNVFVVNDHQRDMSFDDRIDAIGVTLKVSQQFNDLIHTTDAFEAPQEGLPGRHPGDQTSNAAYRCCAHAFIREARDLRWQQRCPQGKAFN